MSRCTAQRRVILEELRGAASHPTADELYWRVKSRLPRVSLATIYRNLEHLVEQGEAIKLVGAGMQRRFDGELQPHAHVRCARCGRLTDAPLIPLAQGMAAVEQSTGFVVHEARVEYLGQCPQCQSEPTNVYREEGGE